MKYPPPLEKCFPGPAPAAKSPLGLACLALWQRPFPPCAAPPVVAEEWDPPLKQEVSPSPLIDIRRASVPACKKIPTAPPRAWCI